MHRMQDRQEAGRLLASKLKHYRGAEGLLVLGLPRGGVPVACEIARALGAPADVFVVRKLGVPGQEELAMGAIAAGGIRVVNTEVTAKLRIDDRTIEAAVRRENAELIRREQAYRGNRPPLEIEGQIVILVDDGIATGSTVRAAVDALRQEHPQSIIIATGTAAASTCARLRLEVDELVTLMEPEAFYSVGQWYADFRQTSDEEVRALLEEAESSFRNRPGSDCNDPG